MMLMLLVLSSIFIAASDPDYHADGYFWMCVHILSTGEGLSPWLEMDGSPQYSLIFY